MSSPLEMEDLFRMEQVIGEIRKMANNKTHQVYSKRKFAEKLLHMLDHGEWPPERLHSPNLISAVNEYLEHKG